MASKTTGYQGTLVTLALKNLVLPSICVIILQSSTLLSATVTVPPAPSFSPAGGTYTGARTVTITDSTPGTAIYYTTDGTKPTASSNLYTGPVVIPDVSTIETINAMAVATGASSQVASAVYTITPQLPPPSFSPATGSYTGTQNITISSPTPGGVIYYTTNGTTPTLTSAVYTSPLVISQTASIIANVTGVPGYSTSGPVRGTYVFPPPVAPAAPSFSAPGGTYTTGLTVTIADATAGAAIYYTTDGTKPTTSSELYSGPVVIPEAPATETINAIAVAKGVSSQIVSAVYTIAPTGPTFWTAPPIGSVNELGTILLVQGAQPGQVLLYPYITGNAGLLVCKATSWNSSGTQLTVTYSMGGTTVHVVIQVTGSSTGVQAQLDADQPVITSVNMGTLAPALGAQAIPVPYYTSNIWYAQNASLYMNAWWDWHGTHATSLNGTGAQYATKTNGTLNIMHELLEVVVSANVDAVLPATGNSPSPYMSTLSGRMVLDIWDQGFSGIQQGLASLAGYGITNCVAIIHEWQFFGYDNGLPQHYPANPGFGGGAPLQAAIAQGNANGCLTAVHENYVDYYPDYPLFNTSAIALNSNGTQMDSWLNPTTGIQSFSTKPAWMVTNASTQSPIIHQQYGTTADYQDVLSAAPISSHGDMDSSVAGSGMLTSWMTGNESLWAYERATHNGPVLGEGNNHWIYSGLLDGVEAQLGAGGVPANSDAALPLFVDFDLLTLHPLQVNHGMGYYERWTSSAGSLTTTTQMDAYRMQEIAFGHAPFLSDSAWSNIWSAFEESNLATPVAASYGTAQATSIQYGINGAWVSSSVAALSGQFTQVQVGYNNGLTVLANASGSPLTWNSLLIPQYGWAAKGPALLAYTAQCGTTICDYAQTPVSVFANARNQADEQNVSNYAAPSVGGIQMGGSRTFQITYDWSVFRSPGTAISYIAFVHFVNDSEVTATNPGIVFQGDYTPSPPTTLWSAGQSITEGPLTVTIPSSVADGTYSIRIGLYNPANNVRLPLGGDNDGTGRYIIGYISISGNGTQVTFTPPPAPTPDPRLNAAGTIVSFPTVQTDGMVSITQVNGQWVLRPYPQYRNFTVLLSSAEFPEPANVSANGNVTSVVVPISNGPYWQLVLNNSSSYSWSVQ
jgi:hypothetical protein